VDQLSIDEVEEAWLSYELQREMEEMASNVRFPVYDASAIDESDKWDVIMEIDFSNGGSFLLDQKLAEEYIPDTLELFAAFVYFGPTDQKRTTWQFDGAVYSAIPQMFIHFAQECRLDSSYRLLRRCVRHTFDSRTGSLDDKSAKLVVCNGEVGIHLSVPIPASMKQQVYDGDVVITRDKILSSKCGCKSGAQKKNRNVCVHTFPRGLLLSVLLAEDLAEHILLELTSMLSSNLVETDVWSETQIDKLKRSVSILMEASGVVSSVEAPQKSSVFDMLQSYKTGTQREKEWNRPHRRPKEDEIGPFDEIVIDSPE
jgi:hypothetical protein